MTIEQLKKYDFFLLIDRSGSMGIPMPDGKSRYEHAKEATIALAAKCAQFDDDGITVIPFNNGFKVYNNITDSVDQVNRIFQECDPMSGTDTAKVLKHVLEDYIARKKSGEAKPIIVIVITDGEPNDKKAVADVIIKHANTIERDEETGITFLQVGNDPEATKFLKKLDDDLQSAGAKFDIVDTKTFDEIDESGMSLAEVLIAALED